MGECRKCKSKDRTIPISVIIDIVYRGNPFEMIAKESMCLDCDLRLIYETQEIKVRTKKDKPKKKGFFK